MKKLITFLGTSSYLPCHYYFEEGKISSLGRFVQTAILELADQQWTEQDQVIVCMTKEAEQSNFLSKTADGERLEGLRDALSRLFPAVKVVPLYISSEQTEEKQWQLFNQLYESIEPGDIIYFDVTHGFRSFPIMALIIWNYARAMKGAALGGIYYGNFESLGPAYRVKEMPAEQRIAPIIDLTQMASLFDWTIGVDHFLLSGDAAKIVSLTSASIMPILKSTKSRDEEAIMLRRLAQQLQSFILSVATCRAKTVADELKTLKAAIQEIKKFELGRFIPFSKLLDKLEEKISCFHDDDDAMNLYYIAKWCLDHQLVQQGLTFLLENLVTAICVDLQLDAVDLRNRELISKSFAIAEKNIPESQWKLGKEEDISFMRRLVHYVNSHAQTLQGVSGIIDARNDINHAGMRLHAAQWKKFLPKLEEYLVQLKPLFEQVSERNKAGQTNPAQKLASSVNDARQKKAQENRKMIIVLSHALTEEQKQEAHLRWQVTSFKEMPIEIAQRWSNIPAEGDWDDEWLRPVQNWINEVYSDGDLLVVQGEPGACCRLVSWLQQKEIYPYYATTNRQVEESSAVDGSIVSQRIFKNVQFRQYPVLRP
jgi:CRISPR-associated Csx2 family protein